MLFLVQGDSKSSESLWMFPQDQRSSSCALTLTGHLSVKMSKVMMRTQKMSNTLVGNLCSQV